MKRVSKQRSRDNARYRKMRLEFLVSHWFCFRCGELVPLSRRQLHHFFGRVHGLLTYEPGFRMVDPECHTFIETNRSLAILQGLRADERLWNRPSLVIP